MSRSAVATADVALVVPASQSLLAGVAPGALALGLATVALLHLGFGAAAGLLGLGLARAWTGGRRPA